MPKILLADKGYDSKAIRHMVEGKGHAPRMRYSATGEGISCLAFVNESIACFRWSLILL